MGYLGFQYATRKWRPNYQIHMEWTGYITLSMENVGLCVTVSENKWGRAKEIIGDLLENFHHANNFPEANLKDMEQKTGFLVHLSMEYPLITAFMIGIYLTMNEK